MMMQPNNWFAPEEQDAVLDHLRGEATFAYLSETETENWKHDDD